MGYSYSSIDKIVREKDFFYGKKILTLGTLYPFLNRHQKKKLLKKGVNANVNKEEFSKYLFVDLLKAESCHSLDVSDYQGSEIICNLNEPIPDHYKGQYDIVIDTGTLEHLSNFSVAFQNIFDLLKKDGFYYFGLPANNWVDHGFFQFSPTFFIDLCIDNPNLELIDLHIGISNKIFKYHKLHPLMRTAVYSSRERLGVGGIIKKLDNKINFNLTQTKYRIQHNPKSVSKNRSFVKTFLIKAVTSYASNRYIPFFIKVPVIKIISLINSR